MEYGGGMIHRHLHALIQRLSVGAPVLVLTGPRQSGKTTLARACFPDRPYRSLEDPLERAAFAEDPRAWLAALAESGAILDEIQRVPELPSFLQGMVDNDPTPGRWILTGSQQYMVMDQVSQSLAGRAALLELMPFDAGELAAAGRLPNDPAHAIWQGGYPPLYDRPVEPGRWLADYLATYVERDVRSVLAVRDLDRFAACVRLCATRIGQVVNAASLAGDLGVDAKTVRAWLSVLSAGYIIHLLPPHFSNFGKRITKQPKLYFLDTGLACRLLGIGDSASLRQHPSWGPLVENWFIAEALKQTRHSGSSVSEWYWWRSHDGLEIDLVRDRGGQLYTCEIKASTSPGIAAKTPQRRFADIAKERWAGGALCHLGSDDGTRGMIRHIPWTHSQALAQLGE